MPIQVFLTNIVTKRRVILDAENFKNDIALQDCFPFRLLRTFKLLGQCFPVRPQRVNFVH
jgi:hypothetical protein